jgi:hypothetical protein
MRNFRSSTLFVLMAFVLLLSSCFLRKKAETDKKLDYVRLHSEVPGDSLDALNGVVVYGNGPDYTKAYGKHYTADSSFYYGQKWQCVEFVKRYYRDHLHFKMPDGSGNAIAFFDTLVPDGKLNKARGLIQFRNHSTEPPQVEDILVLNDFNGYGHMAVIAAVAPNYIEVVQQNIYLTPRSRFTLSNQHGVYHVGDDKRPLGWLRIPR